LTGEVRSVSVTYEAIAHVNGIDMHYVVRGQGRPLVLLHGFSGCGDDWRHVLPDQPEGYSTILPDLRGHGGSTNPSGTLTFRDSAHDVLALMDTLSIDTFQAIGVSAGAKTLLHAATQQRHRLDAMVLVSATPYYPAEARRAMAALSADALGEDEWQVLRARHPRGDAQIRMLYEQGRAFKDSYDDMAFTPPLLSTITARTLIVHGDRDPLYPVRLAFEMHAAIPDSHLSVVPNGGHGPIFGAHAVEFVRTSLAFLRGEWVNR
jgi:pimeloyl-ACP methyl ester carboxylesterase